MPSNIFEPPQNVQKNSPVCPPPDDEQLGEVLSALKSDHARSIRVSIVCTVARAPLAQKKHVFLVMSAPVVDHAKRAVIQEITSKSPFNIFNIVAIVAVLVIGYFLYKKFTDKFQKGAIKIPDIIAAPPKMAKAAPVIIETVSEVPEVIEEPGVKEE